MRKSCRYPLRTRRGIYCLYVVNAPTLAELLQLYTVKLILGRLREPKPRYLGDSDCAVVWLQGRLEECTVSMTGEADVCETAPVVV